MKKTLAKILTRACINYTITVFLILLLYFILNRDLSGGVMPLALILIFPFSVLFATANFIFRNARFSTFLRVLCHAALTLGGTWFCLVLPNRDPTAGGSQALVLFLVLFLIYVLIMGTVLAVKARIHRVKRDEGEYRQVYKK